MRIAIIVQGLLNILLAFYFFVLVLLLLPAWLDFKRHFWSDVFGLQYRLHSGVYPAAGQSGWINTVVRWILDVRGGAGLYLHSSVILSWRGVFNISHTFIKKCPLTDAMFQVALVPDASSLIICDPVVAPGQPFSCIITPRVLGNNVWSLSTYFTPSVCKSAIIHGLVCLTSFLIFIWLHIFIYDCHHITN